MHALTGRLLPLCLKGFMHADAQPSKSRFDEVYADVFAHIRGANRLIICCSENEIKAFLMGSLMRCGTRTLYHAKGLVVNSEVQGAGVGTGLLALNIKTHGC